MDSTLTQVIPNQDDHLIVDFNNPSFIKITKALSSDTRVKILILLSHQEMDVSGISKELNQTEANVSAQIKILNKAGLVECKYEPGGHGVRKICFTAFKKIEFNLL